MQNKTKKTYVITGATSGIGNALVKSLAKENIVFAGYRNDKFIEDLRAISPDVVPFYIDMENRLSIVDAADFIKKSTEKIDVLINGAGCVIAGAVEDLNTDDIRKQFEINTFSHLEFTQKLLDLLDGGRVLNISSMASFGIFPFVAPYCASKRALDILFNTMAIETSRDIKFISIKPGVIATPLWEKSIKLNEKSISNPKTYEKEMKFMLRNAERNGVKGLDVNKAVDAILKVIHTPKPKVSYTVGKDAICASWVAKLPQGVINSIVKFGLRKRVGK